MLNIKTIDRALAKYIDQTRQSDPSCAESLAIYGALLKEAAAIAAENTTPVVQWSEDELKAVLEDEDKTLMQGGQIVIDPAHFEASLRRMARVFLAGVETDEEARKLCEEVDWSDYATASLADLAGTDPMQYMQAIVELSPDENVLDLFVLPVVGFTLRAFLDASATHASQRLEALVPDTVHEERRLACPVCGAPAAIAAVVETPRNGNIKKLYCTCCGGSWKFERIRCAVCGTEAVSDLEYVHDEADDKHRLHVCRNCDSAMPTVFAGDETGFCPDVENIYMSRLAGFWEEEKSRKEAEGEA